MDYRKDKDDHYIHDADCHWWSDAICTCGLLHKLMSCSEEYTRKFYPLFREEFYLHANAIDKIKRIINADLYGQ